MNTQEQAIALSQIGVEPKSGFFDLPKQYACRDPEHHAPTHIHIPAGKGYRHVCPACGTVQIIATTWSDL